ncbi:LysE family translocator [Roseospira marina]|uniref:LysE family translocator n=1 Tax=Roseospira marina TaxID=140057 RepID=A0A5M6IDT8_9PROT|nr:LysE family translocator [Roseospira marina]KAA5606454.1 LysE family translocator [Roseospira marina]MBB4314131.1 threonine/homoserine/homoserine lactone efflux protein [Roseospira marina]MBB5087292.1 threonine/homoserine/homoserine lactone efflux protein [Roseospira marina]
MTPEFLLTALVVVLVPGTGVLYTLAQGLGRGARASVFAAFGCTLGILPQIAASIAGLAAVLHTSALAFQVIKILGVLYLLYMAWSIVREGGALSVTEDRAAPAVPAWRIVRDGILLNILNPKLSLFFLAFLPQFVPASAAHPTLAMLPLAGVFMALTFVVFVGYGVFAATARRRVLSRPDVLRWVRRGVAGTFGLLGLRLALADR